MALVAALSPLPVATTGDMEYTIKTISTLTGLQEVEPGWVLANGVVLPAGTKYDALRTLVGTSYGSSGQLPAFINGVQPIGKGGSRYLTLGGTDGAITVTVGITQISPHQHTHPSSTIHTSVGSGGFVSFNDPNGDGAEDRSDYVMNATGGGGSHNNMPLYLVVEGMMIKL